MTSGPAGPGAGSTDTDPTGSADPGGELLDRVARSALGWLSERRDLFRLPNDAAGAGADVDRTLKPLGELAELTGLVASVHPRADVRSLAEDLFAFAWEQTDGGDLFAALVREEPHATYPLEIYSAFVRAGLRNAEADALATAVLRSRSRRVARDAPTRTLGVLNAEWRLRRAKDGLARSMREAEPTGPDIEFEAESLDAGFARTWLGTLPEPWALDRRAAYGLTHDVFHRTDWGRSRDRLSAEAADYLRLWLPAWAECWLDEEFWDLAGELLAVAACLPTAAPAWTWEAWQRLAAAQDADGGLPETGTVPRPDDPDDPAADFRACYHSTLVAAFAATLARTAPRRPPGASPGASREAVSAADRAAVETEAVR